MVDKEKVKRLLGSGVKPDIVATSVGCHPAYIAQLMAQEDFALEVAQLRTKDLEVYKELDDRYNKYEKMLLDKLEELIPMMLRPKDVLAALRQMNEAKRKAMVANAGQANQQAIIINLQLPNVVMEDYKVNLHGEIVEIGSRTMVAMPSQSLVKTLEERREKRAQLPDPNTRKEQERVLTVDQI